MKPAVATTSASSNTSVLTAIKSQSENAILISFGLRLTRTRNFSFIPDLKVDLRASFRVEFYHIGSPEFGLGGYPNDFPIFPYNQQFSHINNKGYNLCMTDKSIATLSRNKIAMLIDGDNAQAGLLSQMLVEAGRHGQVTVRRIYGDWTTNSMNSWKDTLNFHAFQPIQQFRYTVGKNATDSAMIIDAMDILHGNVVDGFCLVSSDSDYTRLATRIRETGIFVMGIGEKKTPKPFVNACDVFVYTENLVSAKQTSTNTKLSKTKTGRKDETDPIPLLTQAFEMAVQQDGWAALSSMGNALYQLDPAFDPRTYGHKQLSKMISKLKDKFEVRLQDIDGSTLFHVKMKE
jgi:hypothetical protein